MGESELKTNSDNHRRWGYWCNSPSTNSYAGVAGRGDGCRYHNCLPLPLEIQCTFKLKKKTILFPVQRLVNGKKVNGLITGQNKVLTE